MNKRRVENMILKAMDALNDNRSMVKDGGIPSRFNGYIAAFGPGVTQAGLVQTLAFYCRADRDEQDGDEGKDRKLVVDLIRDTLRNAGYIEAKARGNLFEIVGDRIREKGQGEKHRLKSLVLEAAAACKLAMRTFRKIQEQ